MSDRQITIAIDAMGGEDSPLKSLKGAEIFCNNHQGVMLQIFGDQDLIKQTIKNNKLNLINYKIVNCLDNVTDDDNASTILRSRKNSSISRGLTFIKDNPNSGFISAGNTAALMILSRFILGMIEGVDRPAICSTIPNEKSYSLMMDLGANVHVSADNLLQFALMGNAFFSIIDPKRNPKIGLINIGTESNKGLEFLQDAHDLISSTFLKKNFLGFIEPNKITHGYCDIILSDGYTGNIILKTAEGLSEFITSNLKNVFIKSLVNKIAYKMIKKDLTIFKNQIDPAEYNGATFLGVNGISVKSHGNANPYAFSCAINKCYDFILNDLNKKIIENFKN
jgi:phosphate acyltransferase